MRWLVIFCSIVVAFFWLAPLRVVAGNDAANTVETMPAQSSINAASVNTTAAKAKTETVAVIDPQNHAKVLEESLRAVEWYTNESVRKALQAEALGDFANARLFGDKAIESDKKAKDLRSQTAAAWMAISETANAEAVWRRAGDMAEERAILLDKRIPALSSQWAAQKASQASSGSDTPAATVAAVSREQEIIFLQSLYLTAQQWAVAADFFTRAAEPAKATKAKEALQSLLPLLKANDRLQALGDDDRLQGAQQQLAAWLSGQLP